VLFNSFINNVFEHFNLFKYSIQYAVGTEYPDQFFLIPGGSGVQPLENET